MVRSSVPSISTKIQQRTTCSWFATAIVKIQMRDPSVGSHRTRKHNECFRFAEIHDASHGSVCFEAAQRVERTVLRCYQDKFSDDAI